MIRPGLYFPSGMKSKVAATAHGAPASYVVGSSSSSVEALLTGHAHTARPEVFLAAVVT